MLKRDERSQRDIQSRKRRINAWKKFKKKRSKCIQQYAYNNMQIRTYVTEQQEHIKKRI